MATDVQMDEASVEMHQASLDLYREMMVLAKIKDADIQASMLSGMLAFVAVTLWEGRENHATPESIADAVRESALDIMKQCVERQRANTN